MRILIPVDGSDLSETALAAIAPLSGLQEADIRILSLVDSDAEGLREESPNAEFYRAPGNTTQIPAIQPAQYGPVIAPTADPPPRVVETRGEALGRERNEREDYVREMVHRRLPGLSHVQMLVDYSDDPASAIVQHARDLDVDFIAMATHGRSGLRRMLAGSVADKVLREAPMPVMIVGPAAQDVTVSR